MTCERWPHSPRTLARRTVLVRPACHALIGPIEVALIAVHFHDPRPAATGTINAWGDHIGHTAELAATSRAVLATAPSYHASAEQIRTGYGTTLIGGFSRW